jgi:hypothetical protein
MAPGTYGTGTYGTRHLWHPGTYGTRGTLLSASYAAAISALM